MSVVIVKAVVTWEAQEAAELLDESKSCAEGAAATTPATRIHPTPPLALPAHDKGHMPAHTTTLCKNAESTDVFNPDPAYYNIWN